MSINNAAQPPPRIDTVWRARDGRRFRVLGAIAKGLHIFVLLLSIPPIAPRQRMRTEIRSDDFGPGKFLQQEEPRPAALQSAIDDVLLAGEGQRAWLKRNPHPPLDASLAEATAFYGEPRAALSLWSMCKAVEHLRVAVEASRAEATPIGDVEDV